MNDSLLIIDDFGVVITPECIDHVKNTYAVYYAQEYVMIKILLFLCLIVIVYFYLRIKYLQK